MPTEAAPLVAGAVVLLAWAAVADGPLAVLHIVGVGLHRRGLAVIGLIIGALPILTGHRSDLIVLIPCLLVAAVLLRTGLARWASPSADTELPLAIQPLTPAGTELPDGTRDTIRRAGRATGRAGTVVARHADIAVPKGARAAGKIVGRLRPAPKR